MRVGSRFRLLDWVRRWPPALRHRLEWIAVGVIGVVVLIVAFRQPMSERLYPETRGQQLREAAGLALAQGRLTSPDGTGARELYAAALALDPDRNEARVGLQRVGAAALVQATQAIQAQRFAEAHAALRLARELAVPKADADRVAEQLRSREADVAGIESLLAQAAAARAAGRLDGDPDAALPIYRRVLELQPARNEALEGREDALSDLLQQAQVLLAQRKFAEAATLVAHARAYDAGHVGLPDAQAALAQARDRERARGDRALRSKRLDVAGEAYQAAIALDPDDADARDGLARTATALAVRAERQAADFDFDEAERSLDQARALTPESPAVAAAQRHLAQSKAKQARLPTARVTPRRAAEVRRLVASAAEAEARGDLLTPPGDSAYDRLRRARAIAPDDASVQRALARLLPASRTCFDEALRANRLVRAQACLDAREQLGESGAAVRGARNRLALRWIAVGEERLGAGELAMAQRALATARSLDPAAEGLEAFADRTRAATRAAEQR